LKIETEFQIRVAALADIPALQELIEASVRGLQRNDYTPAQMEGAIGYAFGVDTQLIDDGTYFIATPADAPETIVACGGWSRRRTLYGADHGPHREAALLNPATEAAKIRAIFVSPTFARRGLGTLILTHSEEAAQREGFQRLEMGSTLTGVPLYSLKGYREYERIAVPLPNGEVLPIVRMEKLLLPT
jgi:GNAT superfamily N-acetyltransferase